MQLPHAWEIEFSNGGVITVGFDSCGMSKPKDILFRPNNVGEPFEFDAFGQIYRPRTIDEYLTIDEVISAVRLPARRASFE